MHSKKSIGILTFSALLFSGSARAQAYKPKDIVPIFVTFTGEGAEKVTEVRVIGNTSKPTNPEHQPNFSTNLDTSSGKKVDKNRFEIDIPITDITASGDYQITEIRAEIKVGENSTVWIFYQSSEFSPIKFKVENPNTVTKPKISVSEGPKP